MNSIIITLWVARAGHQLDGKLENNTIKWKKGEQT